MCRLALGSGAIDAASFTSIRLFTGALTLLIILMIRREKNYLPKQDSWNASLILFIYAICFSFAYVSLDTGTGALILFGAVQITMILVSLLSGNRLHLSGWMGRTLAFAGFVYLVLPGVSTPPLVGFLLMTSAGIAWGIYTLKGRDSENPLLDTAHNFFRTLPLILILMLVALSRSQISMEGIVLAMLSGGLASGVGYTIWYVALRGLTSTQAAVVQLSVPVIAALGGIIFVSERISLRLSISSIMILGGVLIVVLGRYYFVSALSTNSSD